MPLLRQHLSRQPSSCKQGERNGCESFLDEAAVGKETLISSGNIAVPSGSSSLRGYALTQLPRWALSPEPGELVGCVLTGPQKPCLMILDMNLDT